MARGRWILLLLALQFFQIESNISHLQQNTCGGQVQICAPLSNLPGQQPYLEGLRGQKGEQGYPGKPGKPEVSTTQRLENEVSTLRHQVRALMDLRKTVCPSLTFAFPRRRQIEDYVWYRRYVPKLKALTACVWLNVKDISHAVSVASYAVNNNNNEFVFFMDNSHSISPHYGTKYQFRYIWQSNKLFHVCVWMDSNVVGFSINGTTQQTKRSIHGARRGGGSLILGQEQDSLNAGGLDPAQSFSGTISNFMMWPRVLTAEEIKEIAYNCTCPVDHVISMSMENVELFGNVTYDVPKECPVVK